MAFEDFPVGHRFTTSAITLDDAAIIDFAREHDPQPFHIDAEAARDTAYGGLISSGFQTLLVAFGLTLREGGWAEASMGSPGMNDLRWLRPVRPGDTLHVEAEVTEARASRSKPDRGFVTLSCRVVNQENVPVMTYSGIHILRRRAGRE